MKNNKGKIIEKAVDKFLYESCVIVGDKKEQRMMKQINNDNEYYVWRKGLIKFATKLIEAENSRIINELDKVYKAEGGIHGWKELREELKI